MLSRLNLDGNWDLASFEEGQRNLPSPELPLPIKAKVPSEVQLALIKAGIIDEEALRTDSERFRWVDQKVWCYLRSFSLPDGFVARRTYLEFDGLDDNAAVLLNGEVVGTSHNMLLPQKFDVTEKIKPAGENSIEVDFGPVERAPIVDGKSRRGAGFGMWRSARIVSYDKVSIRDLYIQPSIELHGVEAWIYIDVENHVGEEFDALVSVVVARGESREKMEIRETIPAEGGRIEAVVRILDPELWWPNGMGEQPLYVAMVGLQVEGEVQDVREELFGLRTVALQTEDDEKLSLFVNGAPVTVSGTTWTPPDQFPSRMTEERYREALEKLDGSGVNLLRVCGDGVYEAPVFYKLCDELGIMVWQDFMFATDGQPEPEGFIFEAQMEVREIVKLLRNHPSIVVWCGCGTAGRLFDEIIPRVIDEVDDTRPYRPSAEGLEF